MSVLELSQISGVSENTIMGWRSKAAPTLIAIESAFLALGLRMEAIPVVEKKWRPRGPGFEGRRLQMREIAKAYAEGESLKSVGKRFGLSAPMVMRRLEEMGIQRRPSWVGMSAQQQREARAKADAWEGAKRG